MKDKKKNLIASVAMALTILILLAIGIALRYAYAILVYHDARCTFAECRIQK